MNSRQFPDSGEARVSRRKSSLGGAEEGWGERKARSESDELDITPMIDVTFLLLIFFMVSSTMKPQTAASIPVAQHGTSVEKANATIVYVSPSPDGGEALVRLETSTGQMRDSSVEEARQQISEAVQANRPYVIIKADGDTSHGAVSEIAQMVNSIDGAIFSIGVRDKKTE
jgi:biopolymer transport protein ExbD